MPHNSLHVPRISDAVAASLERRILEGSLKPGDRLPPERELAVEFGVSRPSLREAIQKLSSKGMLQSRQGGGTYVTDRLESSFFDPWHDMLGAHPNLREDMLEFRRMLEGQAAEWAAERATEADQARLDQALAALAATPSWPKISNAVRAPTSPFIRPSAKPRTMCWPAISRPPCCG
jgi:GntR family transcriptional repressor for pyruvate dehydrogenase complex